MNRNEKRKHIRLLKSGKVKAFLDQETGAMIFSMPSASAEQIEAQLETVAEKVEKDLFNNKMNLL